MGLKKPGPSVDRWTILSLAGEAKLDPRTVKRAVEHGVSSLKSEYDRERIREAAKRIGVTLPD